MKRNEVTSIASNRVLMYSVNVVRKKRWPSRILWIIQIFLTFRRLPFGCQIITTKFGRKGLKLVQLVRCATNKAWSQTCI